MNINKNAFPRVKSNYFNDSSNCNNLAPLWSGFSANSNLNYSNGGVGGAGYRGSDYNFGQIGLLNKITHPTSGKTEIVYEANKIAINTTSENQKIIDLILYNKPPKALNYLGSTSFSYTVPVGYKQILDFGVNSRFTMSTYCGNIPVCENKTVYNNKSFRIRNSQSNIILLTIPYSYAFTGCSPLTNSGQSCNYTFTSDNSLELTAGTYSFEFDQTNISGAPFLNATLYASLEQNFPNTGNLGFVELEAGGVRIQSIQDFTNGILAKKKYYKYEKSLNGVTYSSGKLMDDLYFGKLDRVLTGSNIWITRGIWSNYPTNTSFDSARGSHLGYDNVEEQIVDSFAQDIGFTTNNYINERNSYWLSAGNELYINAPLKNNSFKNGMLLTQVLRDKNYNLLSKTENNYNLEDTNTSPAFRLYFQESLSFFCLNNRCIPVPFLEEYVKYYTKFNNAKLNFSKVTNYSSTGDLEYITNITYNNKYQTSSQITSNSLLGGSLETKYFYPQELLTEQYTSTLVSNNRIAMPLKTETKKNGIKLYEQKIVYDISSNLLLQKSVLASKGTQNPENKITYNQYDDKGNIQQYTPESGAPVSIIWGYNKTQLIAKIENATYTQIQTYESNLQTLSNTGTEPNLIIALNTLRANLPNAMVTTYTHKPLVGVSTITDPKGNQITYTYDSFGRLQYVKDKDGNTLSENQYHYKN